MRDGLALFGDIRHAPKFCGGPILDQATGSARSGMRRVAVRNDDKRENFSRVRFQPLAGGKKGPKSIFLGDTSGPPGMSCP